MKVHCKECRCFKDNSVPEHMVCTHETNTEYKHNWYSKLEVYLEHPSSLNTNNDCKNFNPFVDEPICNSQIEKPTVSETESVEKNCKSCEYQNTLYPACLYCTVGNSIDKDTPRHICHDFWTPKQTVLPQDTPKSEDNEYTLMKNCASLFTQKNIAEEELKKLQEVINKVYELADTYHFYPEDIQKEIAEITKPYIKEVL